MADDVIGVAEPARVAQLGPDRHRGDRADAELGGAQRPAAGLAARDHIQLAAQRVQLGGEPVDLAQRGAGGLPTGRGQLHPGDCGTALRGGHARGHRDALVEQGRRDPLMPRAALIEQVLVQPDGGPGFQHVARRDPGLGQVPGGQVRPQVPAVGLIGLGVPLAAAQRRGVSRLGQVRDDPRGEQFLDHITPPGAALQREMHIVLPGKPGQPGPQMLPVSRHHPTPLHLPGHGV